MRRRATSGCEMKIVRLVGAIVCFLLAVGQVPAIYLIASGLLQGQAGESLSYFVGRLLGQLFMVVLLVLVGVKLARPKAERKRAAGV